MRLHSSRRLPPATTITLLCALASVAHAHPPIPDAPAPLQLACTADVNQVYAGEPIRIAAAAPSLEPNRVPVWTWASTGGKLTPADNLLTLDTAGLTPGSYVVTGKLQTGERAKDQAACQVTFTIRPFDPPLITCNALPSSLTAGGTAEIAATASSPQHRPLAFAYTASSGNLSYTGAVARLSTPLSAPAVVTVVCNVTDDAGNTAHAVTQITLAAPATPPAATSTARAADLCTLDFGAKVEHPIRLDSPARACLDQVAILLRQQPDQRLVVIGHTSAGEPPEAAAQRAVNIRQYLVKDKGVSSARVELRIGPASGRSARLLLLPQSEKLEDPTLATFDEPSLLQHGVIYRGTGNGPEQATRPLRASSPAPSNAPSPVPPQGQVPPPASLPE